MEERQQLFAPILPAFVRFCKAFPPLLEDVVSLLLQYGRICVSEASRRPMRIEAPKSKSESASSSPRNMADMVRVNGLDSDLDFHHLPMMASPATIERLPRQVQETFAAILREAVLEKRLY